MADRPFLSCRILNYVGSQVQIPERVRMHLQVYLALREQVCGIQFMGLQVLMDCKNAAYSPVEILICLHAVGVLEICG